MAVSYPPQAVSITVDCRGGCDDVQATFEGTQCVPDRLFPFRYSVVLLLYVELTGFTGIFAFACDIPLKGE